MRRPPRPHLAIRRAHLVTLAVALLALVIAVPVLAAKPSTPPGQAKDKTEKAPITLNGTIESATDGDGKTSYTLQDGGKTYTLGAGPAWFFGDNHPLKPYVGKSVNVEGEIAEGSSDVDVISIDGVALREAGKPPWAGGWRRVGEAHPGWSQEKADRMKAKFGDCFPPGQCKDKPDKGADGADDEDADSD
jgi:hypothetical protein